MSTESRDVLQHCDRLRVIVLQLRERSQAMLSPKKNTHGGYWIHPSQQQHIWKLIEARAPDMLKCLNLIDRSSSVSKDVFLKGRDLRRHLERRGDALDAPSWIGATETMVDELDALLTASQLDTAAEAATNTPTDQVGDAGAGLAADQAAKRMGCDEADAKAVVYIKKHGYPGSLRGLADKLGCSHETLRHCESVQPYIKRKGQPKRRKAVGIDQVPSEAIVNDDQLERLVNEEALESILSKMTPEERQRFEDMSLRQQRELIEEHEAQQRDAREDQRPVYTARRRKV